MNFTSKGRRVSNPMKKRRWTKKKTIIALAGLVFAIAAAFGGYSAYGAYRLNQLSKMTFMDMLAYTTRDNPEAVITVGVIQNGEMNYTVYGENGAELPPEEHIYEIGSITKTFTTSLLSKAVGEGRASFDDPVDRYLELSQKAYYPTLRRLVTHTAGYKEQYLEKPMISNFLRGRNFFYGVSGDMLLKRLEKINLEDADYAFAYSNFGIAAAGAVLEKIYGSDYSTLINTYVTGELGLASTRITDGSGDLEGYWDWSAADAFMPAGALQSNITDMLKYLALQMGEERDYFALAHGALAQVQSEPGANERMGIRIDAVGAGWIIDREHNITWHNGATGHFNSYIGFDKENQIGVVILSNLSPDDRIPATVMGVELLTSLQE